MGAGEILKKVMRALFIGLFLVRNATGEITFFLKGKQCSVYRVPEGDKL